MKSVYGEGRQCGAYVGAVEEMMCVVCVDVTEGEHIVVMDVWSNSTRAVRRDARLVYKGTE